MKKIIALTLLFHAVFIIQKSSAQSKSLVNTSESKYAKLSSVNMGDVKWTKGFWADRFRVCRDSMIPNIWKIYADSKIGHAYTNFAIAAGLENGEHEGPSFQDGDFYKVLEGMAAIYASNKDPKLDALMDKAIAVITKSQRPDGYINTTTEIEEKNHPGKAKAFQDRLNFETYNMGHLMTAACVHYRATGKTSLLKVAVKAADYLYNFYKAASPELARNAICPSHYMGVVEMYRTTHDPKYLELAKNLINIRGLMENGTDDNQDRVPFREQTKAMGHAVRANYLFAGVADVYAETGDTTLLHTLNLMWNDVTQRKMYITGACGALYDGVSPDATSYDPAKIQEVHQAYGRDYQLPNFTAHNETCANIGNVLWNWRMLQTTAKAQYADVMETALYNSVLSGISLNGKNFLYTNPLAYSDDLPFATRWSKDRVPYITLSDCCPPNVIRTIAEVSSYAYDVSDKGLWFNLYGSNTLDTKLKDGSTLQLTQETDYPWNGNIKIEVKEAPTKAFAMMLRIPGWCKNASLKVNGKASNVALISGEYAELNGNWKKGDVIELNLPMPVKLMEANPLVEDVRNQVAVQRGPIVYCIESTENKTQKIFDVAIDAKQTLKAVKTTIDQMPVISLTGKAMIINQKDWKNKLYQEIQPDAVFTSIKLVPYFTWGNNGHTNMAVWMPVSR